MSKPPNGIICGQKYKQSYINYEYGTLFISQSDGDSAVMNGMESRSEVFWMASCSLSKK